MIVNEGIEVVGSGFGNCLAVESTLSGNDDISAEVINLHAGYGCLAALDNESLGVACIGNGDSTLEALGYTEEDLDGNPALREGFDYAIAKILGYKEEE